MDRARLRRAGRGNRPVVRGRRLRLLLDTHSLLWWFGEDTLLAADAYAAIRDPGNLVAISAATVWEIAIKRATGKVDTPPDLDDLLVGERYSAIPITSQHALAAGALPLHHRDPFDRMLVAQARLEGFTIVTRDPAFEPYGVPLLTA